MKKIFFIAILTSFLFTSCEDYLDVNEDQSNRPYIDAISPKQMLAGALNNYTNHQITTLATFGNRMSYVWGLNSGFTSTEPAYTYVFESNSYPLAFENSYIFGDNFQDIIDKKESYPNYAYHFGVAKVFKVMCIDYVTSLYGDAPYSEAFNSKILTPKYDDDKAIIPKLLAELDEAKTYFNTTTTTNPNLVPLGTEDIVFKGNVANWKKFVNTIELRLLMRLSKTTDPTLVALRNSRFSTLSTSFIDQDVTVNPGYNNSTLAQRSPLFRVYGRNESFSDWQSANRANAAGDYIAKMLNGTLTNATVTADVVDPRRSRMFTLVGGTVEGNVQGVFPLTAISRFAPFYFGRIGTDIDKNGCERNAFLMLASESKFLQAEAFQRGYLSGNAQQAFNDGITASFNFYSTTFGDVTATQLPILNASTYISAIDTKNGLGWTGSSNKINAIITQKYLALAQWSGIELYIDHMRTGFPVLPFPNGVTATNRPNRLIYPTSEYSSNSANVPNVTNAELFTVNSKTPYYLQ